MNEMKENEVMPFGKEIRIGNYKVLKFTKALGKRELKALRDAENIPASVRGQLTRQGIPYIKVSAVSDIWSITFCFSTQVFQWLDHVIPIAVNADKRGEALEYNSLADVLHVFGLWMTDTCSIGDAQYYVDKANALKAFFDRKDAAAANETEEEKAADEKVLEEVKTMEEAKEAVSEMADELRKEGGDDAE